MKSYATIKVGDRVAFSRAHLLSTRQFTGWALFARGTVVQLDDFGRRALSPDLSVATVVWGDHEPTRVNVKDLMHEDHIRPEPVSRRSRLTSSLVGTLLRFAPISIAIGLVLSVSGKSLARRRRKDGRGVPQNAGRGTIEVAAPGIVRSLNITADGVQSLAGGRFKLTPRALAPADANSRARATSVPSPIRDSIALVCSDPDQSRAFWQR